MRVIALRVSLDPPVGYFDKIVPFAESHYLHRTGLYARRWFAFGCALGKTECAFAHLRGKSVVVFVSGNLKGARGNAVAAADTFPGIVSYRAVSLFGKGSHDAGRHTGRIEAVHALKFCIRRLVDLFPEGIAVHDRVSVTVHSPPSVKNIHILIILGRAAGKISVYTVASLFAGSAPYAQSRIHQYAEMVGQVLGFFRCLCRSLT
jgi:hypothetical protein